MCGIKCVEKNEKLLHCNYDCDVCYVSSQCFQIRGTIAMLKFSSYLVRRSNQRWKFGLNSSHKKGRFTISNFIKLFWFFSASAARKPHDSTVLCFVLFTYTKRRLNRTLKPLDLWWNNTVNITRSEQWTSKYNEQITMILQ